MGIAFADFCVSAAGLLPLSRVDYTGRLAKTTNALARVNTFPLEL